MRKSMKAFVVLLVCLIVGIIESWARSWILREREQWMPWMSAARIEAWSVLWSVLWVCLCWRWWRAWATGRSDDAAKKEGLFNG